VRVLRSKSLWVILTLGVFHTFNLYSILQSDAANPPIISLAPSVNSRSQLTCEQAHRLMQWGKGHARLAKNLNLESNGFSEKALELFLEKLDGHRLLFTAGEVKTFHRDAKSAWNQWMKSKRCEYFDSWVILHYNEARERFKNTLATLPSPALKGKVEAKVDSEEPQKRFPRYENFASSTKELKGRVQAWVEQVAEQTPPMVVEAYGGDTKWLIRDTLDQLLFESEPDARGILAKAVLGSIDPYSTYFSPVEFEDFYRDLSGGTSGIGIKIRKVPDGLLVEKVVPNSSAARSGKILPGQIITKVDGQAVAGVASLTAKNLLKGEDGTKVKLELQKGYKGKKFTLNIQRKAYTFDDGKITLKNVKVKGRAKDVAVIQIPSFYGRGGMGNFEDERSSSEDLHAIVTKLVQKKDKPSAVVLDLRGNPGGFLEEAVAMAGTFMGDRPVVEVVETDNRRVMAHDEKKAIFDGTLVLLTDQDTASAGEVLAGALKDHQRAVLVGSAHTYGKGSVQKLFHLDDQMGLNGFAPILGRGVVKLTTSVFYSPMGHTPANGGVKPHIVLKEMEDKDSDIAPKLGVAVPEEKPFLDEVSLEAVHQKELAMQPRLKQVESMSELRRKDLEKTDETTEDAWALNEAAAIASDLAALEQTEVAKAPAQVETN